MAVVGREEAVNIETSIHLRCQSHCFELNKHNNRKQHRKEFHFCMNIDLDTLF